MHKSQRSAWLYQDATQAIADGETVFVALLDYPLGLVDAIDRRASGWVPDLGARIAAVESAGWKLEQLTGDSTDTYRVLVATFRRAMR